MEVVISRDEFAYDGTSAFPLPAVAIVSCSCLLLLFTKERNIGKTVPMVLKILRMFALRTAVEEASFVLEMPLPLSL